MKNTGKRILAALLSAIMILEMAQLTLASAAEAVDKALNPAEQIELSVPEELQDAGNYFFFGQSAYYLSETSRDKVYIPVQRTGETDEEAEVTVKVVDLTSHWGENYTFEIYKEKVEPVMEYGDVSLVDLVQTAVIDEVEQADEEEIGEIIYLNGGADIVDVDENVVGRVTAVPLDEDGNPIEDPDAPSSALGAAQVDPGDVDYGDSDTGELRAARNTFTGTVSDRQEMGSLNALLYPDEAEDGGDGSADEAILAEECYPGKEFLLHFDAGEQVKFLVFTPKYSERNDGNSETLIFLRDPSGNMEVAGNYFMTDVTVFDEDEPDPVIVGMKETEIRAEDGFAYITVTRQGSVNDMVGVKLSSWNGTAEAGTEYGGVGAELWFPMGITERTVKLPTGRGAEDKDFYVTINTLLDSPCTIVKPTVHVVIPAAESDPEAELLDDDVVLSDLINLKNLSKETYGHETEFRNSGYSYYARTKNDETGMYAGISVYLPGSGGYAYDGFRMTYRTFRNWASADLDIFVRNAGKIVLCSKTLKVPDGNADAKTYDQYYNQAVDLDHAEIGICNMENHWSAFRDCHVRLWVDSIQMIYRKFNFTVEDPAPMPLAGGGTASLGFTVGNSLRRSFSRVMGEDFTLNQLSSTDQVRISGIEVKKVDSDEWRRIMLSGGTDSGSVTYTLTEGQINTLGRDGYIRWTTEDSKTEGYITVRPIFDYVDVQVEVRDNPYGSLYTGGLNVENYERAKDPTLLWDFGTDWEMNSHMGNNEHSYTSWYSETDKEGNDYFVFRAHGDDPRVSIDLSAADASDVAWAKIRAKNLCGANAIELYGCTGSATRVVGADCVHINLVQDEEWHTYIISIPEENVSAANAYKGENLSVSTWYGKVNWIRLDPMWKSGAGGMKDGDAILIDYIAFFPTQKDAKLYLTQTEVELSTIGEGGQLLPGVYQLHAGDVLNLHTEMTEAGELAGLSPAGVSYQLFDHKNGLLLNDGDSENYINDSLGFELSTIGRDGKSRGYYYVFEPTFAETKNAVTVLVEDEDLAYFDTSAGIFETEDRWLDGSTWHFTVERNVLTNELFTLYAFPADSADVPMWSQSGNPLQYSGTCFYLNTGVSASDNEVWLTVDRTASNHAYYAVSGTVYTYGMILSGGGDSDLFDATEGVPVQAGLYGGVSNQNGDFTIPPQLLVGGTTLRYLVTYNGSSRIQEVKLPTVRARKTSVSGFDPWSGEWKTWDAIDVVGQYPEVPSWAANGVHFTGVKVYQDSLVSDVISALEMTGKRVQISVTVSDGLPYAFDNQTMFEHVKDVTFIFRNPVTKMIHGQWSLSDNKVIYDKDTGAYTLTIDKFTPDAPDLYTAGDVLYVQLTTDRKFSYDPGLQEVNMVYAPISTGVSVFSADDYEPETFEFNVTDFTSFLQTGSGGDTHASFGQFPWMGTITAAIRSFNFLRRMSGDPTAAMIMEDLDEEGGGDFEPYTPEDDGLIPAGEDSEGNIGKGAGDPRLKGIGLSMFFDISHNSYGAVRFKLAAVATKGIAGHYERMVDPYRSWRRCIELGKFDYESGNIGSASYQGVEGIKWDYGDEVQKMKKSEYLGGYLTFSVYVGLYLDYGYIYIETNTDGSDNPKVTTEMVFMGAGGFIGTKINAGYTGLVPAAPIIYYNFEAVGDIALYFGKGADPAKTLEAFENTSHHSGQDFDFTFEFKGRVQVSASFGIGIYKIFGARIGGAFGMDFGYSNQMAEWLPQIGTGWGLTTDITFFGEFNLIFVTIPLWSYSWPLPLHGGWGEYMQEIQRGQRCIQIVEKQIDKGKGSSEARTYTLNLIKQYWDFVDNRMGDADDIRDLWKEIRDYAYDNGIIDKDMKIFIDMLRAGGLAGSIEGAILMDDANAHRFLIRDHVDSKWVADEIGDLMGAFSPVESRTIMENAYVGANPKIQSIGGDRYLMVFLDDDPDRDRLQAGKLMWTVYDANDNSFTEPQTVQDDVTLDTAPFLADAEDKVVLAWSSINPEKYEALIDEVRDELAEMIGAQYDDDIVQIALEEDPSRLSNLLDVYCVEFDKDSESFGSIEQLTDDGWEDADPKVVYDNETKDYIVLYTKTAQDSKKYASLDEQLVDNINPYADPNSTYSVMCYMLYNGTQEDGDEAPVGWVRDHLYDHESRAFGGDEQAIADFLDQYGGQRFLATSFHGLTDPPICDLTVANGYNGLAAYAFTVDRDFNAETAEDRELYVQFYDFKDHKTYVPVKVAGEIESHDINIPDRQKSGYEIYDYTEAVEVAQPKLIRSGGSTWLFWRENNDGLRYLNISELLNAKVSDDDYSDYEGRFEEEIGEIAASNVRYALRDDGTLDPAYTLNVQKVDFGSSTTSGELNVTDYQIITDADDNLYVVWTDTTLDKVYNEDIDEYLEKTSVEIYATARIQEADLAETNGEGTTQPVRWSKPYRLTRDSMYHDGVAITLADDGGLIIVHNEYDMLLADTQEEQEKMVLEGRAGWKEVDGETYLVGSPYYPSESSLMITRCAPVGSLEATTFEYSDDSPMPGDEITVKAVVENTGLTAAYGCDVDFYAVKDGSKVGGPVHSIHSDETFLVNSAKQTAFKWTVPAEGADGYGFMAVISERKADGSFYEEPVESFSDPFQTTPQYEITVDRFEQNGDAFDVEYTVTNTGNAPAPDGMRADLYLKALYGDLREDYGMDDDLLVEEDISGLAAGETRVVKRSVTLPATVFRLCGYDAVQAIVEDERDLPYESTGQFFINMKTPMNLSLNDGNSAGVTAGETISLPAEYDSNAFIRGTETVLYTVDDPSVAMVDKDGNVTGVSSGTTTLTATMISSGQTVSIPLTVSEADETEASTIDVTVGTPIETGEDQITVPVTLEEDLTDETVEAVELTLAFNDEVLELDVDSLPDGVTYDPVTKTLTVPVRLFAEFSAVGLKFNVKSPAPSDEDLLVTVEKVTPVDADGNTVYTVVVNVTNPEEEPTEPDAPYFPFFPPIPQILPGKQDQEPEKAEGSSETAAEPAPGIAVGPAYADFSDLEPGAWYEEGVRWAIDSGIMNGVGGGLFDPNGSTTRAMLVTMLWRMEGEPFPETASPFKDVVPGAWYADAVTWAMENGIVTGYDPETFGPNDIVTREQIVTILYRYAKFLGLDTGAHDTLDAYTDADTISDWALDAFRWAVAVGVIKGVSATELSPKTEATRAQVATMLMRFSRLGTVSTALLQPDNGVRVAVN